MKKCILIISMIVLCLTACSSEKELPPITVKDAGEISVVQFDRLKAKATDFGEKKVATLVDSLRAAKPLEKDHKIARGPNYFAVSFIYEDDSRDIFYFFSQDEKWYIETAQGTIYEDGAFIVDYIEGLDQELDQETSKDVLAQAYFYRMLGIHTEFALEITSQLEEMDYSHIFAMKVQARMEESQESKEDAIGHVKEQMKNEMLLYQYILQQDYSFMKDQDQRIEGWIANAKQDPMYEELNNRYAKFDTTLQETMKKQSEYVKVTDAIESLNLFLGEEFREGRDKVGDKVCWDVTEYWNTFLLEEVMPTMKDYDLTEFLQQLEKGEPLLSVL